MSRHSRQRPPAARPVLRACSVCSCCRSSLVLLAQSDGVLALWELLRRQHAPALSMQVCDEPLTQVVPHEAVRTCCLHASVSPSQSTFFVWIPGEARA